MTSTSRIYKTEAIVLKHFPYGEGDYILTLYTPNLGKIRLMAKGARKIRSKLGGHIEPLMHSALLVRKGTNLDAINQAELLDGYRSIREDLERLSQAMYFCELLDKITPDEEPHHHLFKLLQETLDILSENPQQMLIPYFQMKLLQETGFMPELYTCIECNINIQPNRHRFLIDRGGIICEQCRPAGPVPIPISLQALKVLRFLQSGESFIAVSKLHLRTKTIGELDKLLTTFINHILDSDVKSYRFLNEVSCSRM